MKRLLVLSDAPHMQSGLARISRDLTSMLHAHSEYLDIEVAQIGLNWNNGITPLKDDYSEVFPWPIANLTDNEGWGARDISKLYIDSHLDGVGHAPDIVFTVFDPHRMFNVARLKYVHPQIKLWGYFPIDGHNFNQALSGPPLDTLKLYDRVLAYGQYGARVIKNSMSDWKPQWLPHGIGDEWYENESVSEELVYGDNFHALYNWMCSEIKVIGCIMTNQLRKDMGTLFETISNMNQKEEIHLWLHTDKLIDHWSIPQLVEDFDLKGKVKVSLTFNDWEMRELYKMCNATFLPSLGEGFGYPIVESLVSNVPVVHHNYAGGAELVPRPEWKPTMDDITRLEGHYCIERPILNADRFEDALWKAIEFEDADYCRKSVEHLRWSRLTPRWLSWFKQGLEA